MLGRFPLLTDENIKGPLIDGLRSRGWDVVRVVDVFGEGEVDDPIFSYAAEQGRVLVSTDPIAWQSGASGSMRVGPFA